MNPDALLRQAWLALEGLERTLPSSGAALWQAAPVSRVQRLHQALERSGPIARGLMSARLAGIDLSAIWDVLISACKEIALYFGGSVLVGGVVGAIGGAFFGGIGAIPGAAAGAAVGAQAGTWILGLLGLKSLVEGLGEALPQALHHYKTGVSEAWGPGSDDRRGGFAGLHARGDVQDASYELAQGHVILIAALLTALVAYLTRGRGDKTVLLNEIRNSPRLGPKVADWVMMNEGKLATHPGLQPRGRSGGRAQPDAAPPSPSQGRGASAHEPEAQKSNKEKSLHGEARGREYMEKEHGMQRLTSDKRWNAPGIDDIYKNPKPPPDFVLAEYKYGAGQLGNTRDGLQMSDDWLHGKTTARSRVRGAVDKATGDDIIKAMQEGRVEKWLLRLDESGKVSKTVLDGAAKAIARH